MAREYAPLIVTANDLLEGDAVYFTASRDWSREHGDAVIAHSTEAAQQLLAEAEAQQDKVVGPYLAEVSLGEHGRPEPLHFREAFRTRGPSNYRHGKQAGA